MIMNYQEDTSKGDTSISRLEKITLCKWSPPPAPPLKLLNTNHCVVMVRGVSKCPTIGPSWYRETPVSQTATHQIGVCFLQSALTWIIHTVVLSAAVRKDSYWGHNTPHATLLPSILGNIYYYQQTIEDYGFLYKVRFLFPDSIIKCLLLYRYVGCSKSCISLFEPIF